MIKFFRYELKKSLLSILIFSVIATLYFVIVIFDMLFSENIIGTYTLTGIPSSILQILCLIVPILCFSFKMNKRSVDEFYSLPIRREKLYLVKSLVGLCMVFIPYTISYWSGVIIIATRESMLNMIMYLPLYFASLPCAVLIFGINAFAFTRANKVIDGMIFMWFFSTAFAFIISFFGRIFISFFDISSSMIYWMPSAPLSLVTFGFDFLLVGKDFVMPQASVIVAVVVMALFSAACWFGLFFTQRFDKAENAEQISTSWFGYKLFIPFYLCTFVSLISAYSLTMPLFVSISIGMFVLNFFYRRTFKLPLRDLLVLLIAIIVGVGIGFICS